jgi:Zn-finger nucleic acid-binding protein
MSQMPSGPAPTKRITCPKCEGEMRTYERSGVNIEQCGTCRGIFLDFGELEALTRMEAQAAAPQQAPPPAYPQQQYPPQQYPPQQYPPQQYPPQSYPQQGYPQQGYPGHYDKHHNRRGGFSNLFFSS